MFHETLSEPSRVFRRDDDEGADNDSDLGGLSPHTFSTAMANWLDAETKPRLLLSNTDFSVRWLNGSASRLVEEGILRVIDGCYSPRAANVSHLIKTASSKDYRCAISMDCHQNPWVVWARQVSLLPRPLVGIVIHPPRQTADFSALVSTQTLTPTEGRVVSMLLNGYETGRIAQALNISTQTLKTHIKHAYCKLGVKSRGDLFAKGCAFARP
jgi:DNA-binding CsgD family transcriptional regulator